MKKIASIILALIFVLAIATACQTQDNDPDTTVDPSATQAEATDDQGSQLTTEDPDPTASNVTLPDDTKSKEYFDAMNSGKYYLEATAYTLGFEMTTRQAIDGENSESISMLLGMTTHTLQLGNLIYTLDDENKTYTITETSEGDTDLQVVQEYPGLTYNGSGNAALADLVGVDDNEYYYEEFTFTLQEDGADPETCTLRYYFDGDTFYAMETIVTGVSITMVIETFSTEIPSGMLVLPSDYTEISAG